MDNIEYSIWMDPKSDQGNQSGRFVLSWENVSVSVKTKKGVKSILSPQSGYAESSTLIGIIGASGSGKTTLMNYLSGFTGQEMIVEGNRRLGDKDIDNRQIRGMSGYVLQEDILQSQLTVQENITYSARFKSIPAAELKERVDRAIDMLNLTQCRSTRIGTDFTRGVSGGEKKRCCIAMEIVNCPDILFLDEPTTGLDSVNAEDVIGNMRALAKGGKCVIATIHQPSVDILKMFDKLIIMHEGMAVYTGSYDQMSSFYQGYGVTIPNYVNQVEYILTCLNMNEVNCKLLSDTCPSDKPNFYDFDTVERVRRSCLEARDKVAQESKGIQISDQRTVENMINMSINKKNGFVGSLLVQLSRSFKVFFRDRKTFLAQLISNIFYVGLAAILFKDLGTDFAGRQNRIGVLYYLTMLAIMTMMQITSMSFSTGLPVLKKELMQGQYTPTSYFLGVTIPPDIPITIIMLISSVSIYFISSLNFSPPTRLVKFILLIVGSMQAGEGIGHCLAAVFSDPSKTIAAMPMVLMPLQLFSGFLFDLDTIPVVLKPLSWISIFRYCLEGLITNEFIGLSCDGFDCNTIPPSRGYHDSVKYCIIMLFSIALATRLLSLVLFHYKYRQYYDL